MTLGLDYSAGRPSAAQIRAAGYSFVVRYLDNGLGSGRININAAEFAELTAGGVAVALVWETQATRASAGQAAGAADAAAAKQAARDIGADGWPIYLAVDFDTPDYAPKTSDPLAKLGPVGAYLQGARSVLPLERCGVYGSFYVVSRALDAGGLVSLAWQTLAWSGGQTDPRANLIQRLGTVLVGGVGCDVNEARTAQFGQAVAVPASPTGRDIVFEFVCNGDTFSKPPAVNGVPDPTADNPNVLLLLGGGYAVKAAWADVRAKDRAYGGDGTGSVIGKPAAGYQLFVDLDAAVRARDAHLTTLGSAGGAAGASKQDVADVVDAAFADHSGIVTYNKITGA